MRLRYPEPLVGRGKNLELVPALATKWEQPNPTTWRFHLRPNVKFAGGEPFTADDVIFSVKRMKAEGSDMAYTVASVTELKKIDDLTVDFIMDKPNPILPMQTTSTYIMSKAWSEKNNAAMPAVWRRSGLCSVSAATSSSPRAASPLHRCSSCSPWCHWPSASPFRRRCTRRCTN